MFQFTHPVWGATLHNRKINRYNYVSIHAPRVGCDVGVIGVVQDDCVSIHAPRVGCDDDREI